MRDIITGVLSTFDRMIFKGHILPFFQKSKRHYYLFQQKVLFKDFGTYAKKVSEVIKDNARELSAKESRPLIHLDSSRISKEDTARKIQEEDKVKEGLICVLKGIEPCVSFDVRGSKEKQKLEVVIRERKCLFLYFYYQHKEFGFMHVRLQTWFPFQIQIYTNGREWLAKRLDGEGIGYQRYDNSMVQVDDGERAQEIAEQFLVVNFAKAFDALARQINPVLPRIKKVFSQGYYWVLDQGEYATDVMFKDRQSLLEIYPELVEHALVNFNASDVMAFLGRKFTGNFQGEIITDTKKRPQGLRIKHRMKQNSLKMYDKWSVLRVETTINNPREFKIYRKVERCGKKVMRWIPMGKSVFNLYRYAEVSKIAHERYLAALSAVVPLNDCVRELEQLAQSVQDGHDRYSGFNPLSPEATNVFEAVLDGSHTMNGFRNKDLRNSFYGHDKTEVEGKKLSSKVTRVIRKLRAHKLIAKILRSSRYKVTTKGYRILGASLKLKKKDFPLLLKNVA
ncbi:MAG: hypothetical protein HBSAPP01_09580 [Candidatus Brocadia sapporoensis]|nr:MAG: hypothetical protein HBSAPP01_09580 [Candidatus Brocadia sapporoensis]